MKNFVNKAFKTYLKLRMKNIRRYMEQPDVIQHAVFKELINVNKHTEWGKRFDFRSIKTQNDFARRVPVHTYDQLKPYIKRMMHGEKDVLWSGQIKWFSKSAGTTSDKSKFIPVTSQNLKRCHLKGAWDSMALLYENKPDLRVFAEKNLVMGGSLTTFDAYPKTTYGDVSAILLHHTPLVSRPFYTPDMETALLADMEEKISRMAETVIHENVAVIGGVPSWTVVLFRKILENTGKNNITEVWPNLQAYMHGGVSMKPYWDQIKKFIPSEEVVFQEIYNASEGFFGAQSDLGVDDMLLFLDSGMYFEFVPVKEWDKENPTAIPLWEVIPGENYAVVISTNAGLWRYLIGDTVCFTSVAPYKFRITGRTQQFINAFGEEVMVENTDKALAITCKQTGAISFEYMVAPIYFQGTEKGGHQWLIEFEKMPADLELFRHLLDQNLQKVNGDYEAKRFRSMALEPLQLQVLPKNTFFQWIKFNGKLGGQSKVPRLSNHRKNIESVLKFLENQTV